MKITKSRENFKKNVEHLNENKGALEDFMTKICK